MNKKNIKRIYINDLKRIIRNPIAMIILIGICLLPSLYAWVNIKACWNVYENTNNIPVAVVNNDQDAYFKGKKINIGNQIVDQLKSNKKIKWVFTTSEEADLGLLDSSYYAAIEIPSDFSSKLLTLVTDDPQKPKLIYKVNTKANPVASKITSSANNTLIQQETGEFVSTVNQTVFSYINEVGEAGRSNKESLLKLKDSLVFVNRNMDTIKSALNSIDTNSGNLSGLLDSISSAMPYVHSSIDAIGKTNTDNLNTIKSISGSMDGYSANISTNLEYAKGSNDRIKALIDDLSDSSTAAANTKLNTTVPVINSQISAANRAIDATITYLTQCHDTNLSSDIAAVIVKLLRLRSDLTAMEKALTQAQTDLVTLHTDVDTMYATLSKDEASIAAAANAMKTDLNTVIAALKTLNAVYHDPNIDKLITALQDLENSDIGGEVVKAIDAILATQPNVDKELDSLSATIKTAITATDNAITDVSDAIDILQKIENIDQTVRKKQLTEMINELGAIKPYLTDETSELTKIQQNLVAANGISKSAIDLINTDHNKVANQLNSAIALYNSDVRDDLRIINDNLLISIKDAGDLINVAQDLSSQIEGMVKAAGEANGLTSEFSMALSSKLTQFKDVITSLGSKFENVNNSDISDMIAIMLNDPKLVGDYFSDPFIINEESIYAIPNYGTGMAPIYTALAIWVGCLVLNAILKTEVAPFSGSEALTVREKHFGKMLLFCSVAVIQGLIVSLGDIFIMKIYVFSPPLFVFFCFYSSIVFSVITFTLVSTLGNIGKACSIIYMILQVAGSGGSYPIQIDPPIFRIIQPLFPFTYTLGGLREAIAGPLGSNVSADFAGLTIIMIVFLVCGYLGVAPLRKTLSRFEAGFKKSGLGE